MTTGSIRQIHRWYDWCVILEDAYVDEAARFLAHFAPPLSPEVEWDAWLGGRAVTVHLNPGTRVAARPQGVTWRACVYWPDGDRTDYQRIDDLQSTADKPDVLAIQMMINAVNAGQVQIQVHQGLAAPVDPWPHGVQEWVAFLDRMGFCITRVYEMARGQVEYLPAADGRDARNVAALMWPQFYAQDPELFDFLAYRTEWMAQHPEAE